MNSTYDDIHVENVGRSVAVVRFDRVERNNAVRPKTLAELCHALDVLAADGSVRAIVLAARGRHFVAGADFDFLHRLRSTPPAEVAGQIYEHFQGAARRIYTMNKPTVAAVQGAAITVGCELALACDFRIVTDRATFQESWIRLGLMAPLGGLFLLPRLVGVARASEMVLQGRAVAADEAVEIGLANELTTEDELDRRAQDLAAELGALPPLAYAATKHAMHHGFESTMEREWSASVQTQSMLIGTEDFAEGLAAVQEKRAPHYRGC